MKNIHFLLKTNRNNVIWGIAVALIFIFIPVAMYSEYFLSNMSLGGYDTIQYFVAKKAWMNNLLSGDFAIWNRYLAAGVPQNTVTGSYVISILLSVLPLKYYIYSFYLVHYIIGASFFYLYLRELNCNKYVSLSCAILYEISIQINGWRKEHPAIIAAICLIPLVFFLIRKHINTKKKGWLCLSAIATGLQFTANKQLTTYLLVVIFIYMLLHYISARIQIKKIFIRAMLWILVFSGTIMYSVLPTVGSILEYAKFGSSNISYDTFSSYSMSIIKVIQMIFPKLFGDYYEAFGNAMSTGVDIEIYIGTFSFFLLILAIIKKRKEYQINLLCAAIGLFITCIAHIPMVNHLFYHIPVIGGYRCSGRAMPIFLFFSMTVVAQLLNEIIRLNIGESNIACIRKISIIFFIIAIMLVFFSLFIICIESHNELVTEISNRLKKPIICIALFFLSTYLYDKKYIFLLLFFTISIVEIFPFAMETAPLPLEYYETPEEIVGLLGNSDDKIWDDSQVVNGNINGPVSQNKSTYSNVASINAYIAFNNPLVVKYFKNLGEGVETIPFNYSGLMTGSVVADKLLYFQNDLLSMLGIRYIYDSSNIFSDEIGYECDIAALAENGKIVVKGDFEARHIDDVNLSSIITDSIRQDCFYKISFTLSKDEINQINRVKAGFYGDEQFDIDGKEFEFNIQEDGKCEGVLYCPNTFNNMGIQLRVIAEGNLPQIHLKDVCVLEHPEDLNQIAYKKIMDLNEVGIYENVNVKPLIYSVAKTAPVPKDNRIYDIYSEYDLDEVAYFDTDKEEHCHDASIEILDSSNDYVTAKVFSKGDSFVVFSQAFNSKWNVYIDGIKHKCELVNGAVMGTWVSKGSHIIEFRFENSLFAIGGVISLLTLIGVVFVLLRERKNYDTI